MAIQVLLASLVVCLTTLDVVHGHSHWSYKGDTGPDTWGAIPGAFCNGKTQSPIDLATPTYDSTLPDFTLNAWVTGPIRTAPWKIQNNGHTAKVTVDGSGASTSGGKLPGTYTLQQFHFHWGSKSTQGSEHNVEGMAYPMEMHFVHYKQEYGTVDLSKDDSVAVIAVFFQISDEDNEKLEPIVSALSKIRAYEASTYMDAFDLSGLLPADTSKYFRYTGSFTTPGCNEHINWTLMKDPIAISEKQLEEFRALLDSHGDKLEDNFRPLQDLNGRTIYSSFDPAN